MTRELPGRTMPGWSRSYGPTALSWSWSYHVGDGMRRMLSSMGVELREGIRGDARAAMTAAASPRQ